MTTAPTFRRPEGALLRSGLDAIKRQAIEIPPGKRLRVGVGVELQDGAVSGEIGAAWLTPQGWTVEASVNAAIGQGQRPRVIGAVQFTM